MNRRNFLTGGLSGVAIAGSAGVILPLTFTGQITGKEVAARTISMFPQIQRIGFCPSQPVGMVNYRDQVIIACSGGEIIQVLPDSLA